MHHVEIARLGVDADLCPGKGIQPLDESFALRFCVLSPVLEPKIPKGVLVGAIGDLLLLGELLLLRGLRLRCWAHDTFSLCTRFAVPLAPRLMMLLAFRFLPECSSAGVCVCVLVGVHVRGWRARCLNVDWQIHTHTHTHTHTPPRSRPTLHIN